MKLNFKKYGDEGKVILILHGLFGMLDNWNTIAKKLGKENQVYIIDQRNHGKSDHHPEMDYKVMAEDIHFLLQSQEIESCIIIGHSMGGKTAMQFAVLYPEMTEKLVVVDIAPKAYQHGHDIIFEAFKSLDFDKVQNRKDADEQLSEILTDYGIRQFILKNLEFDKNRNYRWKPAYEIIESNYENIVDEVKGEYSGPSLFIKGGRSHYINEEDEKQIRSQFKNSRITTIADSGHWVHAEKPIPFIEVLNDFITAEDLNENS